MRQRLGLEMMTVVLIPVDVTAGTVSRQETVSSLGLPNS